MSTRQQALSLYRRILRAGSHWSGPQEEKGYIFEEARQQFRANRSSPPAEVPGQLEEGERRLEIAEHYHIAYPRLHHAPQYKYIPPPKLEDPLEEKLSTRDAEVNAKLAAALERRQKRQKEH